jgi:hypothetical protein
MNPETLEALKGSIEKWRKIVEEGGEDRGRWNCPLCTLFFKNCCLDCPVRDATSAPNCHETPYDDWSKLDAYTADTPLEKERARAELNFLRSLLPKEVES